MKENIIKLNIIKYALLIIYLIISSISSILISTNSVDASVSGFAFIGMILFIFPILINLLVPYAVINIYIYENKKPKNLKKFIISDFIIVIIMSVALTGFLFMALEKFSITVIIVTILFLISYLYLDYNIYKNIKNN
ncbi:MAG: hypothetical protein J6K21_04780 [Bacilli bacterium]|nr:hypothetical protein [Bacilli bacterium]